MSTDPPSDHDSLSKAIVHFDPSCAADPYQRWWEIMETPSERSRFLRGISIQQANDCMILIEWLRVMHQSGITATAQSKFLSEVDGSIEARNTYHTVMRSLWQFNFAADKLFPRFLHQHQWLRKQALNLSTAYRTALEWHCRTAKDLDQTYGERLNPTLDSLLPWTLTPRVDMTPWLERSHLIHHPYYLWDIKARRTIRVQDLDQPPAYTAISHTWGRFRKHDDSGPCYASVDGIPWKVPENTRFEVRELPDFLLSELEKLEYVWFDLFCIPQEDLSSPLARQEISRQASIFKNSSASIAWFSDINSWEGTRAALQSYCALIIRENSGLGLPPPGSEANFPPVPDIQVELVDDKTLNAYFSSLWTLQELCLCPQMIICDRRFNPLFIAGEDRPLSPFDVQALVTQSHGNHVVSQKHASELQSRFWDTFYNFNEEWNPITILSMGNQRYCEARRAEAVMSVMGATSWYTSAVSAGREPEEQLVMKKYPMAFISEVRARYGSGVFFAGATLKMSAIYAAVYQKQPLASLSSVGSLLPFGDNPVYLSTSDFVKLEDDTSTADWTLDTQGRVHIRKAFIHLGKDNESPQVEMECRALVFKSEAFETRPISSKLKDLQNWVENFKPEHKNYAVSVRSNDHHSEGFLLRELQPGTLIVLGRFILTRQKGTPWPGGRQEVDWLVL
ncbi:hypothetical protein H2200_011203 [Cladophialophora chaetospira]|uniref:Heterokaryon incompatibility domain-containing protein n=1 Tax=Cladophialophora chaetospira TaxID=386627 RepID=A0AA39CDL3_9EURO|nr:hypothetical protein H2200_011203 [Cladophialophora chaetospira]